MYGWLTTSKGKPPSKAMDKGKHVPGPKIISAKQQSFDTKIAKQSATTSTLSKPVTLQGSQGITETDDTIVPTTDIPSTEICKHPTASSQKESIRIQVDLKDDDPLRVDGVALVQSVRDFGDHVKLAGDKLRQVWDMNDLKDDVGEMKDKVSEGMKEDIQAVAETCQSKVHDAVTATTNAVAATRLAAKDAVSATTLAGKTVTTRQAGFGCTMPASSQGHGQWILSREVTMLQLQGVSQLKPHNFL
mmetsp:Transcript_66029/g.107119  ORF Transcript_66029/g.107119 Transcript_66029/m.107119 type:complete len:246 (-) Transcript_66029:63-800(-)